MTYCSTSIKEYTNGLATTFGKFHPYMQDYLQFSGK